MSFRLETKVIKDEGHAAGLCCACARNGRVPSGVVPQGKQRDSHQADANVEPEKRSGRGRTAVAPWTGSAALALFLGACSIAPGSIPSTVVETEAGPISVEVRGVAGGLTNVDLARLMKLGIEEGCPGPVLPRIRAMAGPSLSMVWEVVWGGVRPPAVIVTAYLFSEGRLVSFAFGHPPPPNAGPNAVFEYAIGGITCALFRKAGYLAEGPSAPRSVSE